MVGWAASLVGEGRQRRIGDAVGAVELCQLGRREPVGDAALALVASYADLVPTDAERAAVDGALVAENCERLAGARLAVGEHGGGAAVDQLSRQRTDRLGEDGLLRCTLRRRQLVP